MEMGKVACLWSGGLDSTTALYYFANRYPDKLIQPYHLLIRRGGGKDARERLAVDTIYDLLRSKFSNVLPPIRIKHRMSPSDDRNEKMIRLLRDEYGEDIVILGSHEDVHVGPEDNNPKLLSARTGVIVQDMTTLGFRTKREQFLEGVKLIGADILKLTWSCQLWFKKPCGRCFSCKDRVKLFEEIESEVK